MWIKGLSHALVSRRFEAEGNLWLVKFMFPSRGESKQKGRGSEGNGGEGGQEIPKTFTFYPSAPLELKRTRSIILLSSHIAEMYKGVFYSD